MDGNIQNTLHTGYINPTKHLPNFNVKFYALKHKLLKQKQKLLNYLLSWGQ